MVTLGACRRIPSLARERAVFSSGKNGEAGDVGYTVDTAGCSQADNSGCLDPPVSETAQGKGPLEARSGSPTGSWHKVSLARPLSVPRLQRFYV